MIEEVLFQFIDNGFIFGCSFSSQGDVVVPSDSYAVAQAKERHHTLFEQIAAEHVRLGAELEAKRALFESTSEIPLETNFDVRTQ